MSTPSNKRCRPEYPQCTFDGQGSYCVIAHRVRCVEAGELAYGAVGWYEVSFGFQRHMNQQAADSSNAIAAVTALLARVAALEAAVVALQNSSSISGIALPQEIDLVATSE